MRDESQPQVFGLSPTFVGIACGVLAALFWATGFVVALHGLRAGLSSFDITLHRFVWAGLGLMPFVFAAGLRRPSGLSWGQGLVLTLFSGPLLAAMSYAGFLFVPLAHGGVIQPSTAALFGVLLSALILKEKLSFARVTGAVLIVVGLLLLGAEALTTIGRHGLVGDLLFAAAGLAWACFGIVLRHWRIDGPRAASAVSVISMLLYAPLHAALFGFERIIAAGVLENALQAFAQGVLAGPGAVYLFARAVMLLGASRGSVFPALVPAFTLLIGFVALGNVPTLVQLAGLIVVLLGFRYVLKT